MQLAKAAIAAGVEVLCAEAGVSTDDVQRVILTGGFGNHLRIRSALQIGLVPFRRNEDSHQSVEYRAIDNGAGRGAIRVIRESGTLERAESLAQAVRYVELSGHPLFQERYIEHMMFNQEDDE